MNYPLRPRTRSAMVGCLAALAVTTAISPMPLSAAPVSSATVSRTPVGVTPISDTVVLRGYIPALVARSEAVARLDAVQPLSLALTLPLRNQAELTDLLQRLYDPADPQYGQYLTPDEFAARFGPAQADYDKAIAYAQAAGLTVTSTTPNHAILDVSGTAGQVERAFGTPLMIYRSPDDGRNFYAPTTEPTVSKSAAALISGIVGLDNAAVWQPHKINLKPMTASEDLIRPYLLPFASTPVGGLYPSGIKAAYNLSGVSLNGTGQSLGLFELANYNASDVTTYENYFGLTPNVTLQNVPVGTGIGSNGADEVTLDIELQVALAPGASKVYVYEAIQNNVGAVNEYNKIASDNLAKQISTSWGSSETSGFGAAVRNSENTAFQQMAAQGQSIFAASGDSGAYDNGNSSGGTLSVDDPASQPYMTGVGGTTLTTSGGAYGSEKTWANASDTRRSALGAGGGGGVSVVWQIPAYQIMAATATSSRSSAAQVSTTMRNVPDVSLDADPNTGYAIYYGGSWTVFGGTSCAAPLWAAFAALVNQQRAASGYNPLGFFNPALYTIANGPRYATDFHDIADGSTNLYYPAVTGYDVATGLGTFKGASLLADLTNSVPISGSVSLQNVQSGNMAQPLTFTITPTGTPVGYTAQPVTTQTVTPSATDGAFTLYGVPSGTYTISVKGAKWLQKNVTADTTAGAKTGLSVTLLGGDLDGSNTIDINDFNILRAQFNGNGPNVAGDLNCDGTVDIIDFSILRGNYGKQGDTPPKSP